MKLTKDILRQLIKEEILAGSGSEFLGEKKNKNKRRREKRRQRSAKRQQFEELKEKFIEKGTESVLLGAEAEAIMHVYGQVEGRPFVVEIYADVLEIDSETQKMRDDNPELDKWVHSAAGQAEMAQVAGLAEKHYEEKVRSFKQKIDKAKREREAAEREKQKQYQLSRRQPMY